MIPLHPLLVPSFDGARRLLRAGLAFAAGLAVGLATISPARAATLQQQCDSAELQAMSKRLRDEAACLARFARKPGADPLGTGLDLCRDAARDGFEERIDAARETAEEEGVDCATSLAGLDPEEAALETSEALADVLLAGWDPNAGERADDKLRARLLKEMGKLAKRHLKAESKHQLIPDDSRRQRKIAKAEIRFELAADAALDRAAGKGVLFAGTNLAALRNQLMALLDGLAGEMTEKADSTPGGGVNPGPAPTPGPGLNPGPGIKVGPVIVRLPLGTL